MFEVWNASNPLDNQTVKTFIVPGSLIWVPNLESEKESFELAKVLSRSGNVITAQMQDPFITGAYRVIDLSINPVKVTKVVQKKKIGKKKKPKEIKQELPPCLPANDNVVGDMTELQYTHKSAILHNLKMRAQQKEPYTFIGSVLVSINPLQPIQDPDEYETTPHPGTIAERAYNKMTFSVSQRRRVLEDNEAYLTLLEDDFEEGEDISSLKKEVADLVTKLGHQFGPTDHSILISGESGAGKTEAAKRVLCRLVDREGYGEINYYDDRPETFDFQDRLIGATPILESFGNAKTHRNPNSSRFGKFLKLWYEPDIDLPDDFCLFGASITTYLLERSRVTYQEPGEKNYRIFYQLLTSPNKKLHKMLGFNQAAHTFRYLGNKKFTNQDRDRSGYVELRTAFQMADIKVRTYLIFQVVAAVLHLGNINFIVKNTEAGDIAEIEEIEPNSKRQSIIRAKNKQRMSAKRMSAKRMIRQSAKRTGTAISKHLFNPRASFITMVSYATVGDDLFNTTRHDYSPLYFASRLLGVPKESLKEILTTSKVKVGSERIVKPLDISTAGRRRDALAKHLYASLFDWLVFELNQNLYGEVQEGNEDLKSFIGVLDVFGFEEFEKNGFEQLLINYANEVLLSLFTREILIGERQLYEEEGLQISDADMAKANVENSASSNCLELFDGIVVKKKRAQGLFAVIDGQGKIPSPSEAKMLQAMHKTLGKMAAFKKPHPSKTREVFIVQHYASTVTYTVGSFLEKNDQVLPPEVGDVFGASTHSIVASFSFGPKAVAKTGNIKKKKGKKKKQTVIGSFANQMNELRNTLLTTNCSYIRCVKPNPTLYFNAEAFKHEIANSIGGNRGKALRHTESMYQRMLLKKRVNSKRIIVPKHKYFDEEYISAQLKNLGIYDCVNVLKAGLPTRMPYPNFVEMYAEIIPMNKIPFFQQETKRFKSKMYVSALMYAFKVPREGFKLGNTRIFFQNGQLDAVKTILKSGLRMAKMNPSSRERQKIMKRFKAYYAKRRWQGAYAKVLAVNHFVARLKRMKAVKILQAFARAIIKRGELRAKIQQKYAATKLQKHIRAYLAKCTYIRLKVERDVREAKAREKKRIEQERLAEEARAREAERVRIQKEKEERERREREERERLEAENLRLEEEARKRREELARMKKEQEELERKRQFEEKQRLIKEAEEREKRLLVEAAKEEEIRKQEAEAEQERLKKAAEEEEIRRKAEEEAEYFRIRAKEDELKRIRLQQEELQMIKEKEDEIRRRRAQKEEEEEEEKRIRDSDAKNSTSTVDFASTFMDNQYGSNAMRGHVQKYFHKRASFNRLKRTRLRGTDVETVEDIVPVSKLSTAGGLFNYGTVEGATEKEWQEVEYTFLDFDGDKADVDLIDDFDHLTDLDDSEYGAVDPLDEEDQRRKSTMRGPNNLPQRLRFRKQEASEAKLKLKKSPTNTSSEKNLGKFEDKMMDTLKEEVLTTPDKPQPSKKKSLRKLTYLKRKQHKKPLRKPNSKKPKAKIGSRAQRPGVDAKSSKGSSHITTTTDKFKEGKQTIKRSDSQMSLIERMAMKFGGSTLQRKKKGEKDD